MKIVTGHGPNNPSQSPSKWTSLLKLTWYFLFLTSCLLAFAWAALTPQVAGSFKDQSIFLTLIALGGFPAFISWKAYFSKELLVAIVFAVLITPTSLVFSFYFFLSLAFGR